MIIAAMCMTSIMASAQKTIRVSTDKTDLVMQVSPKGRLYQVYLGDKLKNPSDYNQLKWDVYAASDGAVCQRGHEVYATSGAEDFFEPAVAVTHADGNMTTYLYYQSSEEKAISGGVETIITLKDKVYPLTVKLHYAAYPKENVIKAWSEISHKEKAPVTLWRYSSTMLYFKANKYFVTNYHSDWAKEGQPETCQLTAGKKIVDTGREPEHGGSGKSDERSGFMIKVTYTELDGPSGPTLRLEAAGHAGYAPAGQDIVCAGASTLMQTLVYLLAGEESAKSDAWDEPEGPRLAVTAAAPRKPWVEGAFEFAKAGFALLAERYPDNVRFADLSGRGEQCMVDLQLFAEGEGGAAPPPVPAPALSRAQQQQAIASGTMKAAEAEAPAQPPRKAVAEEAGETEQPEPAAEPTAPEVPETRLPPRLPAPGRDFVEQLHAQWAAEEALLRRDVPGFSLKAELRDPEMRRLMQLPGMRLGDAYRLAHYSDALRQTARTVEQGVVERIRQRASRPAENGTRPGSAAVTRADVASMTRAQREALERQALHGVQIKF